MNREQYQALIRRLEEYARRNPGGYRLRVGLLAALGYGYLLFILAILAGLLAVLVLAFTRGGTNFIVAKLGWVLIVLAAAIVRAMWVGIPAPSGIELRRDDAPELFGMLDEVRAALRTPRFDHVLLTDEFNAAAAQRPRLGVLGWQKNYLMLGLPMMQALSPEELRAIVAHELGHLSGNHARFGGWIYRVEAAWARLLQRFHEEGNHAAILFERFFNWYVPFFDAYSFVLRRANEYMADECSAEVVGRETTARALFRTEIAGRVLAEHYWPSVYERANRSPQPPENAFSGIRERLRVGAAGDDAADWLRRSLAEKTGVADTHPSLTDRLQGLGLRPEDVEGLLAEAPRLAAAPKTSADTVYLGARSESLAACMDAFWKQSIAQEWEQRHSYAADASRKLEDLEERAGSRALSEEESWERARLTLDLRPGREALPLVRQFVAAHPEHAEANYCLGRLLLEARDDSGIAHLEKAMEREPDSIIPACEALYGYLKEQGRQEDAERYQDRAAERFELYQRAEAERTNILPRDSFEPHGLTEEAVAPMREQLAKMERVEAAYLVRKRVQLLPERACFVLGILPHMKRLQFWSETQDEELQKQVLAALEFPGETAVVILSEQGKAFQGPLSGVAGSEIYRRGK